MAAIARVYQHSFDTNPNTTLALTGGCLNALGDAVAQLTQKLANKDHDPPIRYDFQRSTRFFCFGIGLSPLLGRWNVFLERSFPLRALGGSGKVSVVALSKRVAMDQLFMAPIGLALFIGSMGIMEGRNRQHIVEKYKDMYATALLTNWKVWPVAQLINFRYMPLAYRIPFQSTCGVFWTLYLSILNSKEDHKQTRADAMHKTITQ